MFSDVVVLHGEDTPLTTNPNANLLNTNNVDKKNICSSEKMTQTGKYIPTQNPT